jgi:shikimate kinase
MLLEDNDQQVILVKTIQVHLQFQLQLDVTATSNPPAGAGLESST